MSATLLLALVGGSYILFFGGLSLARREHVSLRFVLEAGILTALVVGMAAVVRLEADPVLFLVVIYLFTMRVRLLVDLANLTARRGLPGAAWRLYELALKLWPDDANRAAVRINQGVWSLQAGKLDDAVALLEAVLEQGAKSSLSLRQESGCRYNLAVAYERKGLDIQAAAQFKAVLDTWPGSEFARRAAAALERRQSSDGSRPEDTSMP